MPESGHSAPSQQPDDADHVLVLCHMLSNRIGRSFAAELEQFQITPAEWRVLLDLASRPGCSASSIAGRWAMDKMAVSRAIGSLEVRGWILRRPSPKDGRSRDIEFTADGRKQFDAILPAANRHYHRLLQGLDKPAQRALRNALLSLIRQADVPTSGNLR